MLCCIVILFLLLGDVPFRRNNSTDEVFSLLPLIQNSLFQVKRRKLVAIKVSQKHNENLIFKILNNDTEEFSPYIVRVLCSKSIASICYVAMQPYLGGPLHRHIRISSNGKLNINVARIYTAELVDALLYLHRMKCIHGDVKSSNCILDHRGRIKLCDFDSATIIGGGYDKYDSLLSILYTIYTWY